MNLGRWRGLIAASEAPWWPWLKRLLVAAFFAGVAWLLLGEARRIDWQAVVAAARQVPTHVLLLAGLVSLLSHTLYSTFDLLGRRYTGHALRTPTVMGVTFVSYAFNLNLGSLVGAVALRYRLYGRLGLPYRTVTRVLAMSMLTNWLGYVWVAGLLLAWAPPALPPPWLSGVDGPGQWLLQHSAVALRTLGLGLLAVGLAYALICANPQRRRFRLLGHRLRWPGPRMAMLQAAMGITHWLLLSTVVFLLLPTGVGWVHAASVLMIASIAGLIARVPAGLGVLEAVFITLMGPGVPEAELLASLLLYRGLYHLLPLTLAVLLLGLTEARAQRLKQAPPAP